MKIAIAQINPTLGDIKANTLKIISSIKSAEEKGSDVVIFPEMAITGYPPKDLVLNEKFIIKNIQVLNEIKKQCRNITAIVGFIDKNDGLHNSAAVISGKEIILKQNKTHLPNYDVFDEKRYFKPAENSEIIEINGKKIGIAICEDTWNDGPCELLKGKGAELILTLTASPYFKGKEKIREEEVLSKRCKKNKIPMIYCNMVGGQDDLIFDGHSYYFNSKGEKIFEAPSFEEGLYYIDTETQEKKNYEINDTEQVYKALILGIKDYFRKNNFEKAIVGLSGGIDSALTIVLAKEALGKEKVIGVTMPSKYSSKESVDDSLLLAKNLGISIKTIPIKETFNSYVSALSDEFKGRKEDVAEENIQARIRGNFLMALSNKFGYIVLSTGNKSEIAVGYCTLYGDMSGGLAVLSDVPKTMVYELAEHYNKIKGKEVIPLSIIEKEPSAELRPNQKDSDSLPEYEILDRILDLYIEKGYGKDAIISEGFDKSIVEKVIKLVKANEYKRYQAALGLKVTSKAFGSGRRMPITNRWIE